MSDTMKAVVYPEPDKYEIDEIPIPDPAPGGALVKVMATTICGTDFKILGGMFPGTKFPHVPGHEWSGEVVAVGRALTVGVRAESREDAQLPLRPREHGPQVPEVCQHEGLGRRTGVVPDAQVAARDDAGEGGGDLGVGEGDLRALAGQPRAAGRRGGGALVEGGPFGRQGARRVGAQGAVAIKGELLKVLVGDQSRPGVAFELPLGLLVAQPQALGGGGGLALGEGGAQHTVLGFHESQTCLLQGGPGVALVEHGEHRSGLDRVALLDPQVDHHA